MEEPSYWSLAPLARAAFHAAAAAAPAAAAAHAAAVTAAPAAAAPAAAAAAGQWVGGESAPHAAPTVPGEGSELQGSACTLAGGWYGVGGVPSGRALERPRRLGTFGPGAAEAVAAAAAVVAAVAAAVAVGAAAIFVSHSSTASALSAAAAARSLAAGGSGGRWGGQAPEASAVPEAVAAAEIGGGGGGGRGGEDGSECQISGGVQRRRWPAASHVPEVTEGCGGGGGGGSAGPVGGGVSDGAATAGARACGRPALPPNSFAAVAPPKPCAAVAAVAGESSVLRRRGGVLVKGRPTAVTALRSRFTCAADGGSHEGSEGGSWWGPAPPAPAAPAGAARPLDSQASHGPTIVCDRELGVGRWGAYPDVDLDLDSITLTQAQTQTLRTLRTLRALRTLRTLRTLPSASAADPNKSTFTVTLKTPDGDIVFECPPDQYVLDEAEEQEIEGADGLPYACRAGSCSACTGKVAATRPPTTPPFLLAGLPPLLPCLHPPHPPPPPAAPAPRCPP